MKPIYLSVILLIICCNAKAQNLIQDPGFEDNYTCPPFPPATYLTLNYWNMYTDGSADYFTTSCGVVGINSVPSNFAGYQAAVDGESYIHLITYARNISDYREYIHTQLSSALILGASYEVSMSVSLPDIATRASNGLGVFFCEGCTAITYPTSTTTVLPFTPQISYDSYPMVTDQTNWTRLSKILHADSAYSSIVIGGFNSDINIDTISINNGNPYPYTGYYIDSVVVRCVDTTIINLVDNSFCAGQAISVPYTVNIANYFNSGNIFSVELSDASGNFTNPTVIGSLTSNISGNIPCIIPATANGSGYRIRITSNSPSYTSPAQGPRINIVQPPTITVTSNSPICEGIDLDLLATTTSTVAYFWSGPDGFYDNTSNPIIPSATLLKSGDYISTVVMGPCTVYDTVSVVVNPIPYPIAGSNSPVCPGTLFQLNATSFTGASYSWSGPGSFASNIANPSWANAVYSDAGTYEVTATLNGCSATAQTNVLVQITTATPVAGIMNNPTCEGFPLNLTATCATPGVTYNWTGPTGFTSTTQNPVNPALISYNNGDFIVKATVNGCVSLPDTVNIQVLPKPYLGNYASPNDTVCEGTVVTFVTVPMNGVVNPVFQWFKNNIPVPGATNLTLIAPYATGDTFYCRTFCQNQCGDNLTLYSNKVGMTVMPIVNNLSITLSSEPAQPLPGNPVTFHATTVSGGYNPQYQWKKNGNDIFGAISAIYNANNLAPYDKITCCVITSDPCANPTTACSDAMVVNFPTSVGEVGNDDIFQLYPNPNDGSFKLKMQNIQCKSIDVVNAAGQVVYKIKTEAQQEAYFISLPGQLPSGVYTIRIYGLKDVYYRSISIVR
jgi:hypothetical protein